MNISTVEFNQLMQTISDGWNKGDARTPALAGGAREAADCFSEDAIYVEPPASNSIKAGWNSMNFSVVIVAQIFP